jgi:hypothetical protein
VLLGFVTDHNVFTRSFLDEIPLVLNLAVLWRCGLQLDLIGTRRFFASFFSLDAHHWQGFLSSRLYFVEVSLLVL